MGLPTRQPIKGEPDAMRARPLDFSPGSQSSPRLERMNRQRRAALDRLVAVSALLSLLWF